MDLNGRTGSDAFTAAIDRFRQNDARAGSGMQSSTDHLKDQAPGVFAHPNNNSYGFLVFIEFPVRSTNPTRDCVLEVIEQKTHIYIPGPNAPYYEPPTPPGVDPGELVPGMHGLRIGEPMDLIFDPAAPPPTEVPYSPIQVREIHRRGPSQVPYTYSTGNTQNIAGFGSLVYVDLPAFWARQGKPYLNEGYEEILALTQRVNLLDRSGNYKATYLLNALRLDLVREKGTPPSWVFYANLVPGSGEIVDKRPPAPSFADHASDALRGTNPVHDTW